MTAESRQTDEELAESVALAPLTTVAGFGGAAADANAIAARYRYHLAHLDLPEARKGELINAVWHIMRSFVDRAFGEDAAQLVRKDGDEDLKSHDPAAKGMIASKSCTQSGENHARRAFNARAKNKETR